TYVSRRLDIVDELRARFLVWRGHQFSKGAVDSDKQLVTGVELEVPHQYIVRPLGDSLFCGIDQPIEPIRACFANTIIRNLPQSGGVELLIIVQGKAPCAF